jgi:hypothetical protein
MNAFLLSCSLLQTRLASPVDVYMGERLEDGAPSGGFTLAFGNCCRKDLAVTKRVKGCPPYPFALKESLLELLKET